MPRSWIIGFAVLLMAITTAKQGAGAANDDVGMSEMPRALLPRLGEEVRGILQTIIDAPALQEYFHVADAPGRKPLVLVVDDLPPGVTLQKFGAPVVVVKHGDPRQAEQKPYLELLRIRIAATTEAMLIYPIEGLRIDATLAKAGDGWRLQQLHLTEQDFVMGRERLPNGITAPVVVASNGFYDPDTDTVVFDPRLWDAVAGDRPGSCMLLWSTYVRLMTYAVDHRDDRRDVAGDEGAGVEQELYGTDLDDLTSAARYEKTRARPEELRRCRELEQERSQQ